MHYEIPTGIVPIGYNPLNQTQLKGKNPQDLNPTKFLSKSCESKEALVFGVALWPRDGAPAPPEMGLGPAETPKMGRGRAEPPRRRSLARGAAGETRSRNQTALRSNTCIAIRWSKRWPVRILL